MARYVVLSFDDDTTADEFVAAVQENGILGHVSNESGFMKHFAPVVRAMFQRPTKFCDCASRGGNIKARGFTRGKKYGWWVCNACKKPTVGWAQGQEWFRFLGRNLLPVSPQAPEYRGDGTWGAPRGEAG